MKNILVKRIAFKEKYTTGKMYVKDDGSDKYEYLCDTLEDTYRGDNLSSKKVKGETAIPRGKYSGCFDFSTHFRQVMPHVLSVPFFEGIRIHCGNRADDTEGCILVGYNTAKGILTNSKRAYGNLTRFLNGDNFNFEIS